MGTIGGATVVGFDPIVLRGEKGEKGDPGGGGNATVVTPEQHGAVGDGVADDTAALNAALAALEAAGGGLLTITGTYLISAPVVVGKGVGIVGEGGNWASPSTIKCGSSTACVQFGRWVGNRSRPLLLEGITIDANGTGDTNGRLQIQAVTADISRVHVSDIANNNQGTLATRVYGHGVLFDAAQNLTIESLDVDNFRGAAVKLDNGAGGLSFRRCEIGTSGYSVLLTDDPAVPNAYPFGSANNYWSDCIFENYLFDGGVSIVRSEAGSFNVFKDCGYSVSTTTGSMTSGALVEVYNDLHPGIPTGVMLKGGNWNGDAAKTLKAINIVGNNTVRVSDNQFFGSLNYVAYQSVDGSGNGNGLFTSDGYWFIGASVNNTFGKDVAASFNYWTNVDPIRRRYALPAGQNVAIEVQHDTDGAPRLSINRDGAIAVGPGNATPVNGFWFNNGAMETVGKYRPSGLWAPDGNGLLAASGDPSLLTTGGVLTVGAVQLVRLRVPAYTPLTNFWFALTDLGSVLTTALAGFYDTGGNRLGLTGSLVTAWSTGVARPDFAALGTPITQSTTDRYIYAAYFAAGTTLPKFGYQPGAGVAGMGSAGITAAPWRAGYITGQTTLPATLDLTTMVKGFPLWAGVS